MYIFSGKEEKVLNIAVCDDNIVFLNEFVTEINKITGGVHQIFKFDNAEDLLSKIDEYSEDCIDLVITDIEMSGRNGIEMARVLKEQHPRIQVIIVTNYTEYIQDAFSFEPIHYILKPIDYEKVKEALERAEKAVEIGKRNTISITSKNKLVRVHCDEIKFVESYMRTILVHEIKCNTELYMKLDEFSSIVPPFFIRTHKSYLVNMNMIKTISNNRIELFSGEVVPVAKAKYSDVKKQVLKYLGEGF